MCCGFVLWHEALCWSHKLVHSKGRRQSGGGGAGSAERPERRRRHAFLVGMPQTVPSPAGRGKSVLCPAGGEARVAAQRVSRPAERGTTVQWWGTLGPACHIDRFCDSVSLVQTAIISLLHPAPPTPPVAVNHRLLPHGRTPRKRRRRDGWVIAPPRMSSCLAHLRGRSTLAHRLLQQQGHFRRHRLPRVHRTCSAAASTDHRRHEWHWPLC